MKGKKYKIVIDPTMDGQRVDLAIVAHKDFDLSRRKLRRILDVGGLYINKRRVRVASRQVFRGDVVEIEYNPNILDTKNQPEFSAKDLPIVFENERVIAFNKPPGLPSQATRDQSIMHAEKLAFQVMREKGTGYQKPIILHRLDKETSGILLFAKSNEVATFITDQFKSKTIEKTYLALVKGQPRDFEFAFECHLSPIDKRTGRVRKVHAGGKSSSTEFRLLTSHREQNVSLIECFPRTGRSHQIRVHLESLGLPIIGDKKYGQFRQTAFSKVVQNEIAKHHMLHAQSLSFKDVPKGERVFVEASPPKSFQKIVQHLNL